MFFTVRDATYSEVLKFLMSKYCANARMVVKTNQGVSQLVNTFAHSFVHGLKRVICEPFVKFENVIAQ